MQLNMTSSFSVIPQGWPLCFLRVFHWDLEFAVQPRLAVQQVTGIHSLPPVPTAKHVLWSLCFWRELCPWTWVLVLAKARTFLSSSSVCVHLSASFEAVSFCISGWSHTRHVSASAPESGIRYRYTKPYQTLLSVFFFPCWDRAASSSGLVWLKCKCPILLWVICRFYLIPQKLSSLRAIDLPPRLL